MRKNKKKSVKDEYYYAIQSLNLFVTSSCNFSCAHCMRGDATNEDLTDYTISKVFRHVLQIDTLTLNGGEVFLKPRILEKIIDTIIEKNIMIRCLSITTNGTLFTEEIQRILDKFYEYVSKRGGFVSIKLSQDIYHDLQLDSVIGSNPNLGKKYIDNILNLMESPYYDGINEVEQLINEGRAIMLNDDDKVETRTCTHYYYLDNVNLYKNLPILYLGPIIGVDVRGNVCETAGLMPAPKERCYGNVRSENFATIAKRNFNVTSSFDAYRYLAGEAAFDYCMYFSPKSNENVLTRKRIPKPNGIIY